MREPVDLSLVAEVDRQDDAWITVASGFCAATDEKFDPRVHRVCERHLMRSVTGDLVPEEPISRCRSPTGAALTAAVIVTLVRQGVLGWRSSAQGVGPALCAEAGRAAT